MKTLEEIKKEHPTLTANGWTYYSRGEKVSSGDILNRPKEFVENLKETKQESILH